MSGSTAQRITAHFGGDWHGSYGTFPAPGHSKRDRGMSIEDAPDAPDGVLVNSFNGGDPLAVKDECRRLGLINERKSRETSTGERVTGTYLYRSADGANLFRTLRKERAGKPKRFVAERFEQGAWLPSMIGGYPAYAYDAHTREGRSALRRLGTQCGAIRASLDCLSSKDRETAIGNGIFLVEGGLQDRSVTFSPGDEISAEAHFKELEFANLATSPDQSKFLGQLHESLPLLDEFRRKVSRGSAHVPST